MNDPSLRAQQALRRIAETLDVSTAFLVEEALQEENRLTQSIEMIQAFTQINDFETRRRCLEFVKDAARS